MRAFAAQKTDAVETETQDLVAWAAGRLTEAGVENARLEAQLLLALTLGISRTAIAAGLYGALDAAQSARFTELVEARCRRVPFAYLRGTQEFYGLNFRVSPAVLIPRPETELLVDFAREKLNEISVRTGKNLFAGKIPLLADVGTGSGCIAIASLAHCPLTSGVAIDLSSKALELARQNALDNGVADRLRFVQADLLAGTTARSFPLILSNPPYIPTGEIDALQPEVRDQEPRLALDGGPDGLNLLRRLARQARSALLPGGWLAVETAMGQAVAAAHLFEQAGLVSIETRIDLAGIERIVIGQRPA